MLYDLIIKNGTLIDGSGLPRYHADVAVQHGRIVSTGKIRAPAREVNVARPLQDQGAGGR